MKESNECLFYIHFLRRSKLVYLRCNFVTKKGTVFLKLVFMSLKINWPKLFCLCSWRQIWVIFSYKIYLYTWWDTMNCVDPFSTLKKITLVYTKETEKKSQNLEWYRAVCHVQHVFFLIEFLIFFENIKSMCLHRYRIYK